MKIYPNQKIIKNVFFAGEDLYFSANRNLTRSGMSLWLYLYRTDKVKDFPLSKVDICEKMGIDEDSYHSGVKELVDKGYLKEEEGRYRFYAIPLAV